MCLTLKGFDLVNLNAVFPDNAHIHYNYGNYTYKTPMLMAQPF